MVFGADCGRDALEHTTAMGRVEREIFLRRTARMDTFGILGLLVQRREVRKTLIAGLMRNKPGRPVGSQLLRGVATNGGIIALKAGILKQICALRACLLD